MAEESIVQLELTLTLPTSLAREAEAQGLLTSPMLEALLRAEVQRRRVAHLFEAADRLAALPLAHSPKPRWKRKSTPRVWKGVLPVYMVADTNTVISGLLWHGT